MRKTRPPTPYAATEIERDSEFEVSDVGLSDGLSDETSRLQQQSQVGNSKGGTAALRHPTPAGPRQLPRRNGGRDGRRRATGPDLNLGRVLGSYRLVELLGEGGMGRVYLAEHAKLGRKVALKLLRPEYAAKRDAVHRFFQEARAVNAIGHKNIVDITDYFELEGGETFFIMELLEGSNLGALIRNREHPLPLHRAMRIALQVCEALEAAHEKSIVHRDLKPDNIFIVCVGPDGEDFVKLLDFGVAKLFGESAAQSSWETAVGSVLGTPAYMSPEQATGIPVDHRTDIYSLGAILYEMFTGRPVFRAKSFGEFVMRHMNEAPVPPRELPDVPQIPLVLEEIILRCLEKDPDNRYQSVSSLRADLARTAATLERSLSGRAGRADAHAATRWQQTRGRVITISAVALFALLASAAFWYAAGFDEDMMNSAATVSADPIAGGPPLPSTMSPYEIDTETSPVTSAKSKSGTDNEARIRLYSQPAGATVYRRGDATSLGTTPLALKLPSTGRFIQLVFQLPGYHQARERVRIVDNAVVSVALEPLSALSDDIAANRTGLNASKPISKGMGREAASRRTQPRKRHHKSGKGGKSTPSKDSNGKGKKAHLGDGIAPLEQIDPF